MQNKNIIKISVIDYNNRPIEEATIQIASSKATVNLAFDKYLGAYATADFKADRYTITISAKGFESQSRSIFIGASGTEQLFIMGKVGMPFYYRDIVKVPFEPMDDLFGVAIQEPEDKKTIEAMEVYVKRYKLQQLKTHENLLKNGLLIFFYPQNTSSEEKQKIQAAIQKQKGVLTAGPLLKLSEKNASLLTDEIIVRFKGGIEEQEIRSLAKQFDLEILRAVPYAGNTYHFKVRKGDRYTSLEICAKLVEMEVAEYAEPNLYHTFEEDAITPNNFLFPEQWDHPILNTPDAWQVLNDNLGAAQRYGSPDVLVAVVDSGVNTNHPQFNGNVSNGQPKVFSAFDFSNMVPNNNSLGGSHGSCCASASVGFTSVSSVVGGVPDGTVGIAGNCRLLGVRRGGTEVDYSDMYIWIGGFNPASIRVGFPAQLSRGADVITSSFGISAGSPISGLMRDTFDHLTTYGRNGKGVVLTFSVGNYEDGNINFHLSRPWAAYQKTFACGASTLGNDGITEIISDYSGSGTLLDFCTPSHDAYVGVSPLHNPPQNYGAWTATVLNGVSADDGNAPRNRERQTTLNSAAISGASSVTVVSTAGMVNGQAILIGTPSGNISASEAKRITAIAGNTISFTPALFRNKANGTVLQYGNRDYKNNFGGTSYSTPVCAGIAALMLSVNNTLTWIEVRELLRETAVKIDPNNADVIGRWRDTANRISTDAGYTGPFFSQFFGYGRLDAAAAVTAAENYPSDRDIVVRDNMADTGTTTSGSPHWSGVDIWVRNSNDAAEPTNYATDANTVHQPPIAEQANWLYVRYKNRGTATSYPFYVRTYIAHYPGTEFIYPDNFIPSVRPTGTIPNPLVPGTYLIGEQLVNSLAAGTDDFVTFEWQPNLIPPQTVMVGGISVTWHPCILVEVSPHDGFSPTGNHIWDNNNLAQKNISILYPDSSSDNATIIVVGNAAKSRLKKLKFVIFPEPRIKVPYFICFPNWKVTEFRSFAKEYFPDAQVSRYKRLDVVWVNPTKKVSFEIPNTGLTSMIIGLGAIQKLEEEFELNVLQYSGSKVTGSYGLAFRNKN